MIGQAELLEAINKVWDDRGLTARFQSLWEDSAFADMYPSLLDSNQSPDQPFPYCVMDTAKGSIESRMSGKKEETSAKREVWKFLVTFNVHARKMSADERSAKRLCADLAEDVVKVFGGHPAITAESIELENGGHLNTQLTGQQMIPNQHGHYQYVLDYTFTIDLPVMV